LVLIGLIISCAALDAKNPWIHLLPTLNLTGISGMIQSGFPKTPISLIIDECTDARLKKLESS
jgi:hypothetical protein